MLVKEKLLIEIIPEEIAHVLLEDRVKFIRQTYPEKLIKQLKWREQNSPLNDTEISIEWANGDKQWWRHGELHREDGPAIVYADGKKEWYLEDQPYYSVKQWKKALREL